MIAKRLKYQLIHLTPSELKIKDISTDCVGAWAASKYLLLAELNKKNPMNIVFDRFHVSEEVYSSIYNRKRFFSVKEIEKKLLNSAVLIMLKLDKKEGLKRLRSDKSNKQFSDLDYDRIVAGYNKYKSILPTLIIDTTSSRPEEYVNKIISFVVKNKKLKIYLAGPIGDAAKPLAWKSIFKNTPTLSFFDPLGDTSKTLLEEELKTSGNFGGIVRKDYNAIINSDIVVVGPGASTGVGMELGFGKMLGKKIFGWGDNSILIKYAADKWFETPQGVYDYIVKNQRKL